MAASPFETIHAPCTPLARGERLALRVSGARAFEIVGGVAETALERRRCVQRVRLRVGAAAGLPALALVFPGPRSYSGEDVVELHVPSSPTIYETIERALSQAGSRLATPGEFTRRAFVNGRLGLREAEAVIDRIKARDRASLQRVDQLNDARLHASEGELRTRALDLLALLEAGLDFESGETGDLDPDEWQPQLDALARGLDALAGPDARTNVASDVPSFLLLGPANAGKTSLFCALGGEGLVADLEGTTRDVRWLETEHWRLGDAPGRADYAQVLAAHAADDSTSAAAAAELQELAILRDELARADGWILVLPRDSQEAPAFASQAALVVRSKSDLRGASSVSAALDANELSCSVESGEGIAELRAALDRLGSAEAWVARWQSERRARFSDAAAACRRAIDSIAAGPECVAADLSEVAALLAPEQSRALPEEVLDRIFGRFCLGK